MLGWGCIFEAEGGSVERVGVTEGSGWVVTGEGGEAMDCGSVVSFQAKTVPPVSTIIASNEIIMIGHRWYLDLCG